MVKTHLSKHFNLRKEYGILTRKILLLTNKRWLKEHIRNNQLKQLTWQCSYNSLLWKTLELCVSFPQPLLCQFTHRDCYAFTPSHRFPQHATLPLVLSIVVLRQKFWPDPCHKFSPLTEQPVLDNQCYATITMPCSTSIVSGTNLTPAKPLSI